MSGWRKRQIADEVENSIKQKKSLWQWYGENNVEITWFVIGILLMATLDSLAKGQYWEAGVNFIILIINYLVRSSGFRK